MVKMHPYVHCIDMHATLLKGNKLHLQISNLEKLGFTTMTAVQQETIPQLLGGKDVLVKSQTGSG